MKKILATALAAALALSNVSVFASKSTTTTPILTEDFSDGISSWSTQARNNVSTDVWAQIEDLKDENGKVLMEKAIHIGEHADSNGELAWFRVAHALGSNIAPGENFSIEFDIMADDTARLSMSVVPDTVSNIVEPRTYVFHLYNQAATAQGYSLSKIYHSKDERADAIDKSGTYGDLEFVRNEVNHIKIDYRLNEDVSDGTTDTVTMTVTNSLGTNSATKELKVRTGNGVKVTGIKAINFYKAREKTASGNIWLDNISVYKVEEHSIPELVEENYVSFANGSSSFTNLSEIPESASKMTLKFDSDLAAAEEDAVSITYGSGRTLPVTLSSSGTELTANFSQSLIAGMTYTVKINSAKVKGAGGNYMPEDKSFTFTVKAEKSDAIFENGYIYNYYFNDDMSNGLADWMTTSMKGTSKNLWSEVADLTDADGNVLLEDATRIGEYGTGDQIEWVRAARSWDNIVKAGDNFTAEFDFCADDNTRITFGLIPESASSTGDMLNPNAAIFHLWATTYVPGGSNMSKIYYSNDEVADNIKSSTSYAGLEFMRDEVNHIVIDYTMNDDTSDGTKDTVTITISNSTGTNSATAEVNFRSGKGKKITGIKGINIYKSREKNSGTSGVVWLKDFKVYSKFADVVPNADSVSFTHVDGTSESKKDIVNPDVTGIDIRFNTAMKNVDAFTDITDSKGNRVAYTSELKSGGSIMSINIPDMLKANETYELRILAGAQGKNGKGLAEDYVYTFKTTAHGGVVTENFGLNERIDGGVLKLTAGIDLTKTLDETKKFSLFIIALGENDQFLSASHKAVTLDQYGKNTFTKELSVANPDDVKKVHAILCTYPGNKIIESKTIER